MTQRIVVIETNEIPLRILEHYRTLKPDSTISFLLRNSLVLATEAKDVTEDFLYPAQTWASLNIGAPYELHKVHWYNDPKPEEYPLYWKTVANHGLAVGLVNTLHSSPANEYIGNGNYRFLIPDCFASNAFTLPRNYEHFQALNIQSTSENGRVSTLKAPIDKVLLTLLRFPALGIKTKTLIDASSLVAQIALGKVNRERLRNIQFSLMSDIFLKQLERNQTDLSVVFTNHVAASMHRYWYALFPNDYDRELFDNEWVARFSKEIIVSLDLLDGFLRHIVDHCKRHRHTLILTSSMGQTADTNITEIAPYTFRLSDVSKFMQSVLKNKYQFVVQPSMVPQTSLEFTTSGDATRCFHELNELSQSAEGISFFRIDQNGTVVTFSTALSPYTDSYVLRGKSYSFSELGFERFAVRQRRIAKHSPEGSLVIFNSETSTAQQDRVDYLEFAPAMLRHFGLTPPDYMRTPTFCV